MTQREEIASILDGMTIGRTRNVKEALIVTKWGDNAFELRTWGKDRVSREAAIQAIENEIETSRRHRNG